MSAVHRLLLYLAGIFFLTGCAAVATHHFAQNLGSAMLNQEDPETVRSGAPAYLLLIDGLIVDSPYDNAYLLAGARLYAAYAGGLVEDAERRKQLTTKSKEYAARALCHQRPAMCAVEQLSFDRFVSVLETTSHTDLEALYTLAESWAGWIQAHSDDWNALADLGRVELLLQHIVNLQPDYARGRAQLYLAVMRSRFPAAMGGDPELSRHHFEQAINYSENRDLMVKVEYARSYARLIFNKALHDRLLQEVLAADPREPDLTLSNILAQRLAKSLLKDDYF